jgi:hypothetical protein
VWHHQVEDEYIRFTFNQKWKELFAGEALSDKYDVSALG